MKTGKVLLISMLITLLSTALIAGKNETETVNAGDVVLSSKYNICKSSKDVTAKTEGVEQIGIDYKSCASSVVNNDDTVQVNIYEGSTVKIDGIEFELKQIYFQVPDKNQAKGKKFMLEANLIHVSEDGSLAVVAVMFEDGKRNFSIKRIWNKLPHKPDAALTCSINSKVLKGLLPNNKSYYRYNVSVGTPASSEEVRWLVFKNSLTVSKEQMQEFLEVINQKNNKVAKLDAK